MRQLSIPHNRITITLLTVLLATALLASCSKGNEKARSPELVEADSIMEEAYTHYDNASFVKSIDMCRTAMETYRSQGDSASLSDGYSHLSACYQRMSMNDSALSNCYNGLRIDLKLNDKDRLSSTYNNMAAIYMSVEHPREAKSFINKAIQIEKESNDSTKLSVRYGIAAEVYLKLNDTDSALYCIAKSLAIDSTAQDTVHLARRLAVMGDIYSARGDNSKALDSYHRAIEQLTRNGDKYSLMLTNKNLGILHSKMGNRSQAIECFETSAHLAQECKARRIMQQDYYLLGNMLAGSNPSKSIEYLKMSSALKDSIYNDATTDLTAHYSTKLESQQKQLTIEEQQHSLTTQRIVIISTSIVILLLLLVCIALFFINLLRARAQHAEKNAERMKNMFFTNVTHEFRTPLTVILGETESLRTSDTTPSNQVRYNAIINQGKHLLDLVNQLLNVSKVKSSIGPLDWHHGDISILTKMIVENLRVRAESEHKTIELECDSQDYNIDFVPEYCHSIVNNLIGNSLKFTQPGGEIKVSIAREHNKCILTIADNGCGIKKEDLPHIFENFYQGANEKASLGTGIGLSLVKQMTEAMNGKIQVTSEENQGTTFVITLPASHENGGYPQWVPKMLSQPYEPSEQDASVIIDSPITSDDKPIALVVEDNNDVASYIAHVLEDKYCVVHAANGQEGLSKARQIVPDIIITDLMMPVIDGYELCRQIRADELLNHIPAIIVTARSSDKDRLEGLMVGADAFLVKPFNNDELKALVQNLLHSRNMLREKFQLEMKLKSSGEHSTAEPAANTATASSVKNTAFMEKVRKIIVQNLASENMNSVFIADKMNLSQRQLNRKVKSVIGIDTASLIRDVRIQEAKQMLTTSDDPVTEIAEKCGFDSGSYFSKIFKQYTSLTPTEYRKAYGR